jgi:hypothetical protein
MALSREKFIRDEISRREEAMEEGMEKGLEIGLMKGREEGLKKREAEIVRTAMRKGRSPSEIADFTGIPLERVKELAGEA